MAMPYSLWLLHGEHHTSPLVAPAKNLSGVAAGGNAPHLAAVATRNAGVGHERMRIVGIVVVIIGVVLLFFGLTASNSLVDQAPKTFTGRSTQDTMVYIVIGIVALVGGSLTALRARRKRGMGRQKQPSPLALPLMMAEIALGVGAFS
jgi:nitrate reductase gamma subunit